ncbi:uncharacterized protein G2W53_031224 [Senna tora]|uniref:Uncharacterized protein n=1 Tax=Senna tora TaxID=362788 RepID=A0A834T8R8_9FABA|nr:uncharacterized protein G2W53_031224 [Senna tora]
MDLNTWREMVGDGNEKAPLIYASESEHWSFHFPERSSLGFDED